MLGYKCIAEVKQGCSMMEKKGGREGEEKCYVCLTLHLQTVLFSFVKSEMGRSGCVISPFLLDSRRSTKKNKLLNLYDSVYKEKAGCLLPASALQVLF